MDRFGNLYVADGGLATINTSGNNAIRKGVPLATVPVAPTVTYAPQNVAVAAGQVAAFGVAAVGTPAPSFQWNFNGLPISGATGAAYSLAAAQVAHAGNYTVTATNSAGSVTSAAATLAVDAAAVAPRFVVVPPNDVTVYAGGTLVLSGLASGSPTPTYEWSQGTGAAKVLLGSPTNPELTLTSVLSRDAGTIYSVTAANLAGSVSAAVTLQVKLPGVAIAPVVTSQPLSQTVVQGAPVTFAATATGNPAPTYQWYFGNSDAIPGATGPTYTIPAAQSYHAGSYRVDIWSLSGWASSDVATLAVTPSADAPAVTLQPQSQVAPLGASVTFTAAASGTPATQGQWYFGLLPIAGATGNSYTVPNLQSGNAGLYVFVATNRVGHATSDIASLALTSTAQSATQTLVGTGYVAGGTVAVSNTLTYAAPASALSWSVLLPTGWSFASASGSAGNLGPTIGQTGSLDWMWSTIPPSPVTFSYTLNVPAGQTATQQLAALAGVSNGTTVQFLAQPDPLLVSLVTRHSADYAPADNKISLLELTRVIELYNTRNGTTRTGCYKVDAAGEDGYAPEPTRVGTTAVTLGVYHSADSNRDGKLSLLELTPR